MKIPERWRTPPRLVAQRCNVIIWLDHWAHKVHLARRLGLCLLMEWSLGAFMPLDLDLPAPSVDADGWQPRHRYNDVRN